MNTRMSILNKQYVAIINMGYNINLDVECNNK